MVIEDQGEVVALLGRPDTYGSGCAQVEQIETHSAIVFLAGERAFKLKRAVRYDYLDFSTVERRRRYCDAEIALNRRTAPMLYRRLAAVTREADGRLALDGAGAAVDWLVEMARFDGEGLFDRLAERHALPVEAMRPLAQAIAGLHGSAAVRADKGGAAGMRWVIDGNRSAFDAFGDGMLPRHDCEELTRTSFAALAGAAPLLDARRAAGLVRQCHGDLHLRNVVMLDGTPTLFDAIEFNDDIACVDVLYDLAFLLMDLWRRGLRRHANVVLNEYLRTAGSLDGLSLLPLFLSCRAAVRAKTGATSASLARDAASAAVHRTSAREYLTMARRFLRPAPPVLVAIGGFSGTGKSTQAARLAPSVGPAPGALHLRSDVVRKTLLGVDPHVRLGPDAYTANVSTRVYAHIADSARAALAQGHGVICDAVYGDPRERAAIAAVAADARVPFVPIWLTAPERVLTARVTSRTDDASDATADVVHDQAARLVPPADWPRIDASGDVNATQWGVARAFEAAVPRA